MKRLLAAFCLVVVFAAALSAQATPKKVLTSKDIDAFVANFAALSEELEAFDEKYPDLFDPEEGTEEGMTPAQGIKTMRAIKVPAEIDAVFKKHGLGTNGFEKFIVITASVGVAGLLESLDGQQSAYAEYPEMLEYMEQVKTQMQGMKGEIHPADYDLVASRKAEILPLLESLDEGDDMGSDGSEGDYGDAYGDYEDYGDSGDEEYSGEE